MAIFDILRRKIGQAMGPRYGTFQNFERITGNYQNLNQLYDSFASNPTVYSVVSLIADKCSQGIWSVNRVKSEAKHRQYKAMNGATTASLQRMMILKAQALEQVDSDLLKLMHKPNAAMGQDSFMKLLVINYLVGGAGAVWKNNGGLESVKKPVELWPLPVKDLTISTKDLFTISGFQIESLPGFKLPKESVVYWSQPNPLFETDGSHLYGLPPLRAALIELITSKEGRITLGSNFKNNGSKGVLYDDADATTGPLTSEQVEEYRKVINDQVNGGRNGNRVAFMGARLGYINLAAKSEDMALMEGLGMTSEMIYSVFGVDPVLFSSVGSTYANKEQAQKALITNVAAPIMAALRDELNRDLLPLFHKEGYSLDVSFDHLPEMQADLEKLSATLNNMPFLTYDEKRLAAGYEEKGGPYATAYIPSGVIPIDDAGLDLGDSSEPLNDGNL